MAEFLKAGRTESESGEREFYFLEVEGIDFLEGERILKTMRSHTILCRGETMSQGEDSLEANTLKYLFE